MDEQKLLHIAHLARLHVPEEERAMLVGDIEHIVGFVDTVANMTVSSIVDTAYSRVNIFRTDEVNPLESSVDLVQSAPLHRDGYVEVPKVIE